MIRAGVAVALAAALGAPAVAQGLTGDWGGARDHLAAAGVTLRADVTGYGNGLVAGTGGRAWNGFGRYDVLPDIDFGKLGLVKGLGFHAHVEGRFGDPRGNFGGQLWPANSGAVLPLGGRGIAATSLYLTQNLGRRTTLILGKINALDLLAGDPVLGGWGTKRFSNLAFVAPPSGVVPPVIMGGVLSHRGTPISLTLMVFDPRDRSRDYAPGDLFASGVNVSMGATWSGEIGGRATSLGVTAAVTTKRGQDLQDILAPPGLVTSTRKGSYNIAVQANHRLAGTTADRRLDLTVKAAIADGNPNLIRASLVAGVVGQGLIPGRPRDSFGVGIWAYELSRDLRDAATPLVDINNEQGAELWYSLGLTSWFRLTGDVQIVNPARGDSDIAVITGLRGQVSF